MNLKTLIKLCKMYAHEGNSVQDQFDDAMSGLDWDDLNQNALDLIADFCKSAAKYGVDDAQELADSIDEYLLENK